MTVPDAGAELTKENILKALGYEEYDIEQYDCEGSSIGTLTVIGKKSGGKTTYKTTLYTDGTFIINEPSSARSANIESHGAVVKDYVPLDETNTYVFENKEACPWVSERNQIKNASFGAEVSPTSMAFWFAYSGIESLDMKNCDTSLVENMRSMFYGCKEMGKSTGGYFSFVGFRLPLLTNMNQMFRDCTNLGYLEFVGNTFEKNITAQGWAQGCTSLYAVTLYGTNISKISDTTRMFADDESLSNIGVWYNDGPDNPLWKEYTSCENAESSNNMFRGCVNIRGVEGTTYDSSKTDKTYAHYDEAPDNPGYFQGT